MCFYMDILPEIIFHLMCLSEEKGLQLQYSTIDIFLGHIVFFFKCMISDWILLLTPLQVGKQSSFCLQPSCLRSQHPSQQLPLWHPAWIWIQVLSHSYRTSCCFVLSDPHSTPKKYSHYYHIKYYSKIFEIENFMCGKYYILCS